MTDELKKEIYAIASVNQRNNVAYGAESDQARVFSDTFAGDRTNTKQQLAIGAVINAVSGGFDYSYGATNWDGLEQAKFKSSDKRYSDGRFEEHKNTQGWSISDDDYKSWKSFAKDAGYAFHALQVSKSVAGTFHKHKIAGNKIGLKSTAVYGGTIFWKH